MSFVEGALAQDMVARLELSATAQTGGVLVGVKPCSVFAYGGMICDETGCTSTYRVGNANGC